MRWQLFFQLILLSIVLAILVNAMIATYFEKKVLSNLAQHTIMKEDRLS